MKVEVDSLDKVGFGIKLEQIIRLRDKGQYEEATKVADTIEWRKVKKWSELSVAQEVYEKAGRFKDARNICVYAYNRNLGGKRLLYKLTELSIVINDLEEAAELYNELIEEAPNDAGRFILLYRLNLAQGAPIPKLIEILEEYKSNELEEQYEYELAMLYAKAGRIEECVRECDDLILWFNEGEYVEKALELKQRFAPLSRSQQAKYDYFQEVRRAGINPHVTEEPEEEYEAEPEMVQTEHYTVGVQAPEAPTPEVAEPEEEVNLVPEKDYNLYDTQNIQAELAKSMATIMDSISNGKQDESAEAFKPVAKAEEPAVIESLDSVATAAEKEVDYSKVMSEVDVVSEPTKEIRINTHHWNNAIDITAAQEVKASIAAMAAEAIATTEANKNAAVATAAEEAAAHAQEVIEGQIGLLDWLNSASFTEEAAVAKEPVTEPKVEEPVEVIVPEVEEVKAVEETRTPKVEKKVAENIAAPKVGEAPAPVSMDTTEMAINMLTEELMKEVKEEMAAQEAKEPIPSPEEEYVTEEPEVEIEANVEEESEGVSEDEFEAEFYMKEQAKSEEVSDAESQVEEEVEEKAEPQVEEEVEEEAEPQIEEKIEEEEAFEMTPEERKYVRKYLGMEGMEKAILMLIRSKKEEVPNGTSAAGNIVITGRADADKAGFAINLFKAIHASDDIRQLKIAKTTAGILNKKGVAVSADKIKGTTMIIENAGALMPETVKELSEFMQGDTENMLVILTGEDYSIKKLFIESPSFAALFTHAIELKKMSVNDLVVIAKDYAKENGYSIDEKALLKVYLLIDELQNSNSGDDVEGVKAIVDGAISKCNKKGPGLFGRKSGGMTPLKEKHF